MPTVAIVDGVKIVFYANEHPPAHFHAKIAEFQAVIGVDRLTIVAGRLPPSSAVSTRLGCIETGSFAAAIAYEEAGPIE